MMFINESAWLMAILYFAAGVLYLIGLKKTSIAAYGTYALIGALLCNAAAIVLRTVLIGRLPLSNSAEFILFFSFFTAGSYLVVERKTKSGSAGGAVSMIAFALIFLVLIFMPGQLIEVNPLPPSLKSAWLTVHVLTAAISYGAFAVAAGLAAMQLKKQGPTQGAPWVYRTIVVGFTMLTITIIMGAIWAEQVWGSYWHWDPKETWALITWIIYAIYLHLHQRKNWQGKRANIIAIIGFILVMFTFLGVSYLLGGVHSYT